MNFNDTLFLLQHSAFPIASGLFFFLLGLWFAYLLWHRWVRHLKVLRREHRELVAQLDGLKAERAGEEVFQELPIHLPSPRGEPAQEGREWELPQPALPRLESRREAQGRTSRSSLIEAATAALAARAETLDGKAW